MKCPNCKENTISVLDKLFRMPSDRVECDSCHRKITIPTYAPIILRIAVLSSFGLLVYFVKLNKLILTLSTLLVAVFLILTQLVAPLKVRDKE